MYRIEKFSPDNHLQYDLSGFFEGWPEHPDRENFLKLLSKSYAALVAIDDSQEKIIGFITAISDGVLSCYIPFLEVLPEHRGRGIGTELVKAMLKELSGFYMIDLSCDEKLIPFYERLEFVKHSAMIRRDYKSQMGR